MVVRRTRQARQPVQLGQVVNLLPLLGLAVAVFGAATLLHFLLVSVAR
jgi:hypothetical protein